MAQKDILVNLNLHGQTIKEFLLETITLDSSVTDIPSALESGTTAKGNSLGKIVRVVVGTTPKGLYMCYGEDTGYKWEKIADKDYVDDTVTSSIKGNITQGNGITITETANGISVSVNNGDGLAFTDGKVGVDVGRGLQISSSKVATNLVGGNGITITDDTDTTKQTFAVKIKSEDKLLSIDTNGISSTLSLTSRTPTTSETNYKEVLELKGVGGTLIGSIPVYKDSSILSIKMVKSGATYTIKDGWIDGTGKVVLGYAYLDANGAVQVAEVDISQLILEGEIGEGLEVVDNVVKIKLDTNTESFLTLSADGLKLSGIQNAIDTAKDNAITESKEYTDTKTKTHTHNGTDSQRISYFDLDNQPSFNEARQYQTAVITGTSGTIKAQVHQCGSKPIAVCKSDGEETWVSFKYETNGDIKWSVTKAFTQTDNAVIVVTGCSNDSSSGHGLEDMWFGYEIDETESNPRLAVTRIAGSEAYKKAVFGANGLLDGNLFRYVSKSATDGSEIDITESIKDYTEYSKYKYGGLDGEDGDRDIFAVPKSQLFFKVETEGDTVGSRILRKKISLYQLEGFQPYHVNHNVYIGLYEATRHKGADGTISGYNTAGDDTLCSRVINPNNYTDYQGGNETSTTSRSAKFQGQPSTYIQTSVFSNLAHNKNTSAITDGIYEEMDYMTWLMLYDLYICDFGTLNSQDDVNGSTTNGTNTAFCTARDSWGFRQGGLGNGATTIGSWDWNSDVCACGVATKTEGDNYVGSKCGQASFVAPYGNKEMVAAIFYGIENPFGNIWTMLQGLHLITTEESGSYGASCYICNDPDKFSIVANRENFTVAEQETAGYIYEGLLPNTTSAYYKNAQFGVFGSLLPTTVGSNSGAYYCDYYYTATKNVGVSRLVWFGGSAGVGTNAGFGYLLASCDWTYAYTHCGSRLCFFKKVVND